MGLDMAKYRLIFLEESTDHLAEMSDALLGLEKEMSDAEAIDTIFRMAHSIKSMAASLGFDSVADLSHRIEDRMEGVRTAGRVRGQDELKLLFRGLETLEAMVAAIGKDLDPPAADEALLTGLAAPPEDEGAPASQGAGDSLTPEPVGGEPKKVLT